MRQTTISRKANPSYISRVYDYGRHGARPATTTPPSNNCSEMATYFQQGMLEPDCWFFLSFRTLLHSMAYVQHASLRTQMTQTVALATDWRLPVFREILVRLLANSAWEHCECNVRIPVCLLLINPSTRCRDLHIGISGSTGCTCLERAPYHTGDGNFIIFHSASYR